MIFLVQFGINKHLQIFQRPQIALALRTRAILLVFENFTRAYLFQIALEIMWLPIQNKSQIHNLLFAEVSQRLTALSVALLVDLELLSCRSCSISSSVLVWNCLAAMTAWKIICLTRLANKFAAVSKVHDLITCESKVQVVFALGRNEVLFALGRHEVLTNDTWHVLLQSENIFELGGVTNTFVSIHRSNAFHVLTSHA